MMSGSPKYAKALFTGKQAAEIDAKTISDFGIDGITLMEVAATAMFSALSEKVPENSTGIFLCGKGNNAGDGYAVARIAAENGHKAVVLKTAAEEKMSPDTQKNYRLLKKMARSSVYNIRFEEQCSLALLEGADYIFDALLGTGIRGGVKEPYRSIIEMVNVRSGKIPVFSADVPSGLNADTGKVETIAVKADCTFNAGLRKLACYIYDGIQYSGSIKLCHLPFPAFLADEYLESTPFLSLPEDYSNLLQYMKQNFLVKDSKHKYENGRVAVIGGSPGLTGAAILAAKAAWSTGCGSVSVLCPEKWLPVYDAQLTEQTKVPVADGGTGRFCKYSVEDTALFLAAFRGCVLVGPGIGRDEETVSYLREVLKLIDPQKHTLVVDADAFYAMKEGFADLFQSKQRLVVTPHYGEQQFLHGKRITDPDLLAEYIRDFPCNKNMVYVVKGLPVMTATYQKRFVMGYDPRIFNRTGYGDVLAGKIAGYLSRSAINQPSAEEIHHVVQMCLWEGYSAISKLSNPSAAALI
ncbi:MAG: NAD(P)H-hydrate epimerase [Balneolales bacterium]|nr:NAD(P)H-hydrate epimerase [Balneolales bacterium]